MTSIFAYPVSNAWVIVGDKLETYTPNSDRETIPEGGWEVVPLEIVSKIEQKENWILGFAGMSEDIEKIKAIFCRHINADQGFVKIHEEILKLFEKIEELTVEGLFFDIIKKKCYRIVFSKLDSNKIEDYEVHTVDKGFIGTGPNKAKFLLNQLRDLELYELTEKPDLIIKESVSTLDRVSRTDCNNTGNPYVVGCEIFIIKDGKAKKYEIRRTGVRFREENKGDWKTLEL